MDKDRNAIWDVAVFVVSTACAVCAATARTKPSPPSDGTKPVPPVPVEGIDLQYAPQFKYRETYYLDGFDPLFKVRSKGNFTSQTRYLLSELKFVPPEMGGNHRLYFFKGRRSAYHSFFEILPPQGLFREVPRMVFPRERQAHCAAVVPRK